jgi:type IV pilus assembly protein PilM
MSSRLFYRDRPLFGLEVSQTGLRTMALDKKMRVLGYGNLDVDPIKLEESINKGTDYLMQSMHQLLSQKIIGHLPSNRVALSVPTARTFTRSMALPTSAEENLLEAVQLESEQYIPVPISELYMDYQVIKRTKGSLEVLMCAVPKRLVNALVTASQAAHLDPVLVEPAMLSLARLVNKIEDGQLPTIIVDVGAASTDIAILDRTIRVTGGAAIGGHTFTLDISRKLKIPLEEAHQLKIHNGLGISPKQAKIHGALKESLDEITTEVRKVLRYYAERIGSKSKIEQIIVVGSGSNLPGLGDYFTETLMMPARSGSPWQSLDFDHLAQPSRSFRTRYVTAIGLAMVDPEDIWHD